MKKLIFGISVVLLSATTFAFANSSKEVKDTCCVDKSSCTYCPCPCTPDCQPGDANCICPSDCDK